MAYSEERARLLRRVERLREARDEIERRYQAAGNEERAEGYRQAVWLLDAALEGKDARR